MKAHTGVDADSGIVRSVVGTAAKVGDARVIDQLLHGKEQSVHGNKAYASDERNLLLSDSKQRPIWCGGRI